MAKQIKQFTSWSASRLDDYTLCPLMAKLKHLDKLCTVCFKGKIMGGFDGDVAACDACGKSPEIGAPLVRGGKVGENLEKFVNGTGKKLHEDIRHPKVVQIASDLRKEFKKGEVKVELSIVLTQDWKVTHGKDWSGAWYRGKLDVFRRSMKDRIAFVTDWKTGGIDKRTGAVRSEAKYDDQLLSYQVAAFSLQPDLVEARAALCFVDCGPRFEPMIDRPTLLAKNLVKAREKLVKLVKPMMSDRVFAPRPNEKCGWCAFSKAKGGPCRY